MFYNNNPSSLQAEGSELTEQVESAGALLVVGQSHADEALLAPAHSLLVLDQRVLH
jgi:hypothetical protein